MNGYAGKIPPCGIFCGGCPVYRRAKNPCPGAEQHCLTRKCKGIYVCCIEKKGLAFCYQCPTFPCRKFRQFAERWQQYGQDLLANQQQLQAIGEQECLTEWNNAVRKSCV